MPKKQKSQRKRDANSMPASSRNWEQWRDADDHTGDNLMKGHYDTPQDYVGSEEYQTNLPMSRANRVEQALIFMRKLLEKHHLKLKSDGIIGERILIVIDGQDSEPSIKDTLLAEYNAAGYGSVRIEIRFG
jgi:hypothetical protein